MTLADIDADLPWGLHDAYLEGLALDWPKATLTMTVRVMMTEHQDMDQRASILVTGLVFCAIDAPVIDPHAGHEPTPPEGLWIDSGTGPASAEAKSQLPTIPDGCFLHWFFVQQWNRFIHVCGRRAELTWIEPEPVASRAGTRALFPGEAVPDPIDEGRARDLPRGPRGVADAQLGAAFAPPAGGSSRGRRGTRASLLPSSRAASSRSGLRLVTTAGRRAD